MSKQIIVVAASVAESIGKTLEESDLWDQIEMVIVPDDEFQNSIISLEGALPDGKILRDMAMDEFVKIAEDKNGNKVR